MSWFEDYKFILASKSPRRQNLLKAIGVDFRVQTFEVEEIYPSELSVIKVPEYLAALKANPFEGKLDENEIVISADTVVILDGEILGKPQDEKHAYQILQKLSNKIHQVVTGVCLKDKYKKRIFSASTNVCFRKLTEEEIHYYIKNYKPFDKAGSYGIQEWIGYIGIRYIEGSFYNVMGLPVQKLFEEIQKF